MRAERRHGRGRRATDQERLAKKNALKSKTLWINIITVAIACAQLVSTHPTFTEYAPHILLVVGLLNIILRAITTSALTLTLKDLEEPVDV